MSMCVVLKYMCKPCVYGGRGGCDDDVQLEPLELLLQVAVSHWCIVLGT